jgi:putative ABC transport system permease protein
MRDWQAFVRQRLALPRLTPERESRIVRELAAQLEDFSRDAIARGATDDEAEAYAAGQIRDWDRMAQDVWLADRPHRRPSFDRFTDTLDRGDPPSRGRSGGAGTASPGGLQMFADMLRDIRYAIRQLAKSPGFMVVAALTLALGIGATTAMFSVINGVLLRPLPYDDPGSLVRVHEVVPQYGRFSVAPATFLDWRQQNRVFEQLSAYSSGSGTLVEGSSGPERVPNAAVTWELFDLLRVNPTLGRTFTAAEDAPGKNDVIVLSYAAWQRRFGGDPNVLARKVALGGRPVTIIGVMPAGFYFPTRAAEFWTPLALNPSNAPRGAHFLGVIGRIKTGVSERQAETEMKAISERLAVQYPENSANESAETVLLHDQVTGAVRPALLTLLGAVAVVILIACANVANLLLVRATVREREIAIRTALGAGRTRLVRQMLAESLVLSLTAGALGLLFAYLTIQPLRTLSAGSVPRVNDISIDPTVLLFALAISLATGIVFGLAPAWQASRTGVGEVLKEGGRSSTSVGGQWVRSGLLVAEVALSIVLLVAATLLVRSFWRLTNVDPGFRAENVLTFVVSLPQAAYPQPHTRVSFYDTLLGKLESLPRVTAAGMVQSPPLLDDYVLAVSIQGRPPAKPGEELSANHRVVSPNYFKALGIPLLRGRTFTDRDTEKSLMVAVVDEAFAARHFPTEDPIGRGLDIGNGTDGFYEIVGIVGNVHYGALDTSPTATMYVPYKQDVFSTMGIVVRTVGDPELLTSAARQIVREIDSALPAYSIRTLASVVSGSVAQQRFSMLLLSLFAGVALFLAAVGLYGVVSYTVGQRTQEIGVRMAMGAQRTDVLGMVIAGGMKLVAIGVVIGLAGALALSRVIETMLFDMTPFDPASYAATAGVLLAVAALACYVPARRATRVDPIVAMRP